MRDGHIAAIEKDKMDLMELCNMLQEKITKFEYKNFSSRTMPPERHSQRNESIEVFMQPK